MRPRPILSIRRSRGELLQILCAHLGMVLISVGTADAGRWPIGERRGQALGG